MASLVKELDKVAAKNKDTFTYVVYLNDDQVAGKKTLASFAKTNKLAAVDLTLNKSGSRSPRGYKLSSEVKHTVLMYTGKKVVQNFALNKIDAAVTKKVVAAATEVFASKSEKGGGKKRDKRRRRKKDAA